MRLDKLNDWVKVPVLYIVSGVLAWAFAEIILALNAPFDALLLVLSGVILIASLVFSGMLLKDVKMWKVFTVFTVMYFLSQLLPQPWMILLSAGAELFLHFYTRFFENIKLLMPVFMSASMVAPLAFTYIGIKAARTRDRKISKEEKVGNREGNGFAELIKILAVYLITCFVVYGNSLMQKMAGKYGIIFISIILLIAIYIFAGIYLKNTKAYKIAVIFMVMPCIAGAFAYDLPAVSAFFSGGGILFGNVILNLNSPIAYILNIMAVTYLPFILTYAGIAVGRKKK